MLLGRREWSTPKLRLVALQFNAIDPHGTPLSKETS